MGINRDDHTGPTHGAAKSPDFAALLHPITLAIEAVQATADPVRAFEEATALAAQIRLMVGDAARLRRRIVRRARANGITGRAFAALIDRTPARVSQLGRTPRQDLQP